jgi:type III restriction enzyme
MGIDLKPIVLIKSVKISQSEEDREFFDSVISSLHPDDLKRLLELGKENINREHEILKDMFAWLSDPKNGMVTTGDWDGLHKFVNEIRASFAHDNTLIYNSQKKEKADLLPLLDSPRNTIRAIFSVNALNEGWDVLSLYDIIHFDISESKKVSLQDIQLIGRGARYFPYELPKEYTPDEKSNLSLEFSLRNLEFDKYKRKFDNAPYERGRVLETFVYHFVKTGMFLENLQRDLLGEGIINEGVEKKTITLKQHFLESDTYTKGFLLVNQKQKRTKTTDEEIDTTFNRTIKAGLYNLRARALSDYEQNQQIASQKTKKIKVTEEYFSEPIIRKALVSAEANFFRFNNLIHHLPDLNSVDELIEKYLPQYEITYTYEDGKDINLLSAQEKLQLLVGAILPEVRRRIDIYMPRESGSNVFRPVSLSQVFGQEKNIYLMSFPTTDPVTGKKVFISTDERAKAQSEHDNPELQYNVKDAVWYAYSENYGTSEEKKFVRYLASQIEDLQNTYKGAEIYLIRNELDYWLYSINDGRRFSPDYILIINDVENKQLYYQVIIEPKGGHLLEQDSWKEEALIALNNDSEVIFDSKETDKKAYSDYLNEMKKNGYKEIKPIGIKFYNSDTRGESDFALDFEGKLLTKDGKE